MSSVTGSLETVPLWAVFEALKVAEAVPELSLGDGTSLRDSTWECVIAPQCANDAEAFAWAARGVPSFLPLSSSAPVHEDVHDAFDFILDPRWSRFPNKQVAFVGGWAGPDTDMRSAKLHKLVGSMDEVVGIRSGASGTATPAAHSQSSLPATPTVAQLAAPTSLATPSALADAAFANAAASVRAARRRKCLNLQLFHRPPAVPPAPTNPSGSDATAPAPQFTAPRGTLCSVDAADANGANGSALPAGSAAAVGGVLVPPLARLLRWPDWMGGSAGQMAFADGVTVAPDSAALHVAAAADACVPSTAPPPVLHARGIPTPVKEDLSITSIITEPCATAVGTVRAATASSAAAAGTEGDRDQGGATFAAGGVGSAECDVATRVSCGGAVTWWHVDDSGEFVLQTALRDTAAAVISDGGDASADPPSRPGDVGACSAASITPTPTPCAVATASRLLAQPATPWRCGNRPVKLFIYTTAACYDSVLLDAEARVSGRVAAADPLVQRSGAWFPHTADPTAAAGAPVRPTPPPRLLVAVLRDGGPPLLAPPNVPHMVITLRDCVMVEQRRIANCFLDEVARFASRGAVWGAVAQVYPYVRKGLRDGAVVARVGAGLAAAARGTLVPPSIITDAVACARASEHATVQPAAGGGGGAASDATAAAVAASPLAALWRAQCARAFATVAGVGTAWETPCACRDGDASAETAATAVHAAAPSATAVEAAGGDGDGDVVYAHYAFPTPAAAASAAAAAGIDAPTRTPADARTCPTCVTKRLTRPTSPPLPPVFTSAQCEALRATLRAASTGCVDGSVVSWYVDPTVPNCNPPTVHYAPYVEADTATNRVAVGATAGDGVADGASGSGAALGAKDGTALDVNFGGGACRPAGYAAVAFVASRPAFGPIRDTLAAAVADVPPLQAVTASVGGDLAGAVEVLTRWRAEYAAQGETGGEGAGGAAGVAAASGDAVYGADGGAQYAAVGMDDFM